MKKMVKLILFFIMFIPFVVKAESFKYQIVVNVNLENKELEENEFTFELIDSDGNLVDTKKNDIDGVVTFDSISFTANDVNLRGCQHCMKEKNHGYRFYTVKQVIENENDFLYDTDEAYIGVYIFADGTSEIHYLKNIDKTIEEWSYKANRDPSKIFHATDEQLQGQAYAELDKDTGILTFFRDENNKYTDNQVVGNKVYYTNFENSTSIYNPWSSSATLIKKIVFKDAIKPLVISGSYSKSWFKDFENLEEIEDINLLDTSLVTSFERLFEGDGKLKEIDLTTWDTSNVTNMQYMFYECENLEEAYIDNFDTSNVTQTFFHMFSHSKIKTVDASIFDVSNASNLQEIFSYNDGIKSLDFSTWNVNTPYDACIACYTSELRYIDVSTLKGLASMAIGPIPELSIIKFGSRYEYFGGYFGQENSYWFDIINKKLYSNDYLHEHLGYYYDLETSTYVRPDNNPIPSLFTNKYLVSEPITSEDIITSNAIENPNTKDMIKVCFLILLVCVSILFISFRNNRIGKIKS